MGASEPVAIVGAGCVLPGCSDLGELARLVLGGEVVADAPDPSFWGVPPEILRGGAGREGASTDRIGHVDGFRLRFDASGSDLGPGVLESLDPLFQWGVQCGADALAGAGIEGDHPSRGRAGVVLGNLLYPTRAGCRFSESVLLEHMGLPAPDRTGGDAMDRFAAGLPAQVVARALGLRGAPAYCIDAACASGLYAIRLACQALRRGEADLMLAGGLNCSDPLFPQMGFSGIRALSPTGASRPFHRDADGMLPAQGAAVVALMRLSDALERPDRILGLIRGSGIANDGRTGGFLVPSLEDQVRCMESAYAEAGVAPESVSYVECHATGTAVGDGVELRALGRVFARSPRPLALGSLKANMGHLVTASGAAGVLKVLALFRAGRLPPSPNAHPLHPLFEGSNLRVPEREEPWESSGPRRAAVSSFGFGGNNAHLVLEEWRPGSRTGMTESVSSARSAEMAVVALAVRTDAHGETIGFAREAMGRESFEPGRMGTVAYGMGEASFPPRDLGRMLGHQQLLFRTAIDAIGRVKSLDPARAAVLAGVGAESEAARGRMRWALDHLLERAGIAPAPRERDRLRDRVAHDPDTGSFLGSLSSVAANRIGNQYDLKGFGFSVAAEEASGDVALHLALRALEEGEIDVAVVGAVDATRDPVSRAAYAGLYEQDPSDAADAAAVLVVKRLDDALREGETVLCTIATGTSAPEDAVAIGDAPRANGRHAASGMLRIACAVVRAASGLDGGCWSAASGTADGRGIVATARRPDVLPDLGRALAPSPRPERSFTFPIHLPDLAGAVAAADAPGAGEGRLLPPPPPFELRGLAVPSRSGAHAVTESVATAASGSPVERMHAAMTRAHEEHLERLKQAHHAHLGFLRAALGRSGTEDPRTGPGPAPVPTLVEPPPRPEPAAAPAERAPAAGSMRSRFEPEPWMEPRGPAFDRSQLERLASGRVSEIFGPLFAGQDHLRVQVRMPMPPLLLADSVLGIEGEPMGMGSGKIWTETVVNEDSWHVHRGWMPAGAYIEAGQADLLLVSWLGINGHMRGERVYRLLGGDVMFLAPPPRVGDVVRFQIVGDGFARHGGTHLFFFHFDGTINGSPSVMLRNGQAGFFTREELDATSGLVWEAAAAPYTRDAVPAVPKVPKVRATLARAELERFFAGDLHGCFGDGFEAAAGRSDAPTYRVGRHDFLDEVVAIEPHGGPAGRGRIESRTAISPDDWYFASHFLNDPCMPGTMMIEACVQLLAVHLSALGFTLDRPGWRFEPVAGIPYRFRCRGQISPTTREVRYEAFVDEIVDGPEPAIYAHVLGWVDGLKAFGCERMGIRLVRGDGPAVGTESVTRAESPAPGRVEHDGIESAWKSRPGAGESLLVETGLALLRRFVRHIEMLDPADAAARRGRPALYLANHQIGIETFEFLVAMAGLEGIPMRVIAKQEHRATLLGRLLSLGSREFGAAPPLDMFFADRTNTGNMLRLFQDIAGSLRACPASLLVHVDGTRATGAGTGARQISSVLLDMAAGLGMPVVPVRFLGGLPRGGTERLEFPVDFGRQDILVGSSIAPDALAALPAGERTRLVLERMNALGPPLHEEAPLPGDADFASRVARRAAATGLGPTASALVEALEELPDPGTRMRNLRALLRGDADAVTDSVTTEAVALIRGAAS